MFGIGHTELLIVAVIALLLFGSRLPALARSMGQSITEFRRGINSAVDEVAGVGEQLTNETREINKSLRT